MTTAMGAVLDKVRVQASLHYGVRTVSARGGAKCTEAGCDRVRRSSAARARSDPLARVIPRPFRPDELIV